MFRVPTRVIADAMVVAIVLFVAAGTLAWRRAWVLLAVLLVVTALREARRIGEWMWRGVDSATLRTR